MQKILHSNILRSIRPHSVSAASVHNSASGNLCISNEVLSVLHAEQCGGPGLTKLVPFLNREVVISVLESLSRHSEDPRVCFRFFVWASGNSRFRSGVSFNLIVYKLMEDNSWNTFDIYWSVLDEFRDKNLPVYADAFLVLMLGYWRLKKAEKVVETFGRMKDYDCEPNIDAYNKLLNVLVKKDLVLLALAVYNIMLKSNSETNRLTFNVLLDGLSRDGRTKDAVTLFDEMNARGISPCVITYTVLISGLFKANRPQEAHRFFDLMNRNGIRPDSAVYNALLDGFCKCGQIDKALMLLKSSEKEFHLGLRGLSSLIDGLIRAKRYSEAEKRFNAAVDAGLEPDLILYTIMMRGLCDAGRITEAAKMLRDMTDRGVSPDTQCYNTLIKGFCDRGLLDDAKSLKLEISRRDEFPNTCTYTILICGMCRNGLLDDAEKIFEDMEKLGCPPSAVTFNALIDGFCKDGLLSKAQLTFYKMEIVPSVFLRLSQGSQLVPNSSSLQNMVEKMVSSGSIHKAYKLLVKLSSGVVPNTKTYNILINGMCKAGQVSSALMIFKELQLKRCEPDSVTYATLMHGLLSANREEDASKLFERMEKSGCRPNSDVYKTFMTWACRRRKMSVALKFWLKYIRSLPFHEHESLTSIEECFNKGDVVKAFRSILEIETKLGDFDSGPCNIFLIGLCQDGMVEEALKAFFILEELAVIVSAPGCVRLIYSLCPKGKLDGAVDVFLYSMEKGHKLNPDACKLLLESLVYSKDKRKVALELVDRMELSGYDTNLLF